MYHAVRNEDTRGVDDARIVHYESPGVRYYNTPPQFERHSENIPKRAQNHTRYPKPYQITKANTYPLRLFASNAGGASLLTPGRARAHPVGSRYHDRRSLTARERKTRCTAPSMTRARGHGNAETRLTTEARSKRVLFFVNVGGRERDVRGGRVGGETWEKVQDPHGQGEMI